jgi:hypothetical protein
MHIKTSEPTFISHAMYAYNPRMMLARVEILPSTSCIYYGHFAPAQLTMPPMVPSKPARPWHQSGSGDVAAERGGRNNTLFWNGG